MPTAGSSTTSTSYWCYRCSRFVRVWPHDAILCPDCDGGFLEQIDAPPNPQTRRRSPNNHHHMTFNPVIVLRGGPPDGPAPRDNDRFELYYDDGAGSGLRPLPDTMSDFLMGSGFERLLDQLAHIEINGRGCDHPPASKAAVESMPTVEIVDAHIGMDSHCAVCKDRFLLGSEAREMPCKHIYHQDCIMPWLSMRNSCPVCRHEMPTDVHEPPAVAESVEQTAGNGGSEEETVGLTIWRLPGGGYAVGRFSGGRAPGERELPVVYTEMDGGFNRGGAPRTISWPSRRNLSRESGGIRQAFRNFLSFFGRRRSSSGSRSRSESRTQRSSIFSRNSTRRNTNWALEDDNSNSNSIARW